MISRVIRNGWQNSILLLLVPFVIGAISLGAAPLPVRILQFQQDRLYFNAGTECLIFENAPFLILNSGDTLYSDFIERSDLGVSYSRPLNLPLDSFDLDSLVPFITPATVDSTAAVSLVTFLFRPTLVRGGYSSSPLVSSIDDLVLEQPTHYGQGIAISMLKQELDQEMADSKTVGDALLSLRPTDLPDFISDQSLSAPFIAVLIPNLSHPINKNGLLTTSIYYRYNEQHLEQIFARGDAFPFNRLYASDDAEERYYKYDSQQAARLFDRIRSKPKKLLIAITDPALESTGKYFADILARDRITVEFAEGWKVDADLYLTFVELRATDPAHSLFALTDLLKLAGSTERLHTETLGLIDDKLESYRASADSSFQKRILRQIGRMMQEDLGVFPLFRPTLYYAHAPKVRGMIFDNDHLPEYDQLVKLVLPTLPEDTVR